MKVTFLTNTPIEKEWVDELKEYVDWDIKLVSTTSKLVTKWNPYFGALWGDFDWIRSQITTGDIKCFVTTQAELKSVGITSHIGMYDKADGDTKHDFYIGLPLKLDRKAKANGFKSNFVWLVLHEYLHGAEKQSGGPDRVHDMDAQGKLKELLKEHKERYSLLLIVKKLLETIVGLLTARLGNKPVTGTKPQPITKLQPLVERRLVDVILEMKSLGHEVRMVEGYRSPERQTTLYNQGRVTPGAIVTNAKAGESFHQYGIAVDLVFRKEGYDASHELWETLGRIGEMHGFDWGGRWKSPDKAHFEMPLNNSLKSFQQGTVDYSKYL